MTITVVTGNEGGLNAPNATSVALAFTNAVAVGDLVVVMGAKDSPSTNVYTAGNCTKSAGTATIDTPVLDFQREATLGTTIHDVGIWSCLVTGAGTLTMQLAGAVAGSFLLIGIGNYHSTIGWNSSRLINTNSGTNSTGAPTSGNVTSPAGAVFVGPMNIDTSTTPTITPAGGWSTIFSEANGGTDEVGAFIRQIVSTGSTLAANWTSPTTLPWMAAVAAYQEVVATGLFESDWQPTEAQMNPLTVSVW